MYRVGFRGRGLSPRPSRRVSDRPLSAAPRFRNVAWCGCCAGETVQRSAEAHPLHRLPNLWAGSDHLRRPHAALGLPPMIPRGSRTLRCGQRRSSRRSSGPHPRFTQRARGTVTPRADLRPAKVSWTFAQPPWELRGGFLQAKFGGATSLALALRSLPRGLGERRAKGIPLLLGALCACAAPRRVANGIFRATWP